MNLDTTNLKQSFNGIAFNGITFKTIQNCTLWIQMSDIKKQLDS